MGWDEALFGFLFRSARRFRQRGVAGPGPHAVPLDDVRERLTLVASVIAEDKLDVREAEHDGGWSGDTVWLPRVMDIAPDRDANARAFVLRVAFAACSRRLGLVRAAGDIDPLHTWLVTVLAAGPTRREMFETLGSTRALDAEFAPLVVAIRPDIAAMRPARVALECLLRERLDQPWRDLAAILPAPLRSWLDEAVACAPSAALLATEGDALYAAWKKAGGERMGAHEAVNVPLWGSLMLPSQGSGAGAKAEQNRLPEAALARGTERKGKPREHVEFVELAETPLQDNPLVHSFEKVHTAEEYKGGRKAADGSDEMKDHADALDELDLREVVRSRERTASLLRVDAMFEGTAGDLSDDGDTGPGIAYDEWDDRTRTYRPDWCTVRVGTPKVRVTAERAEAYVQSTLLRMRPQVMLLRSEFERILGERAWRTRQTDGTELDMDAVVDFRASLKARRTPSERIWTARRRHERGLAVMILLDASLSADGWVAGRRVMDVEREAVLVLGEALDGLHDEVAVAAFHSNTRRDCRFVVLKGMREPWRLARSRIPHVEPAGYTRIGPALRHGIAVLEKTHARRKLLLLVSDGRPTDFDRYEGSYGIADVRQAVREADAASVHLFALAVDARSRVHLPEMLGPGRYDVLAAPEDLPRAAAALVGRVLR